MQATLSLLSRTFLRVRYIIPTTFCIFKTNKLAYLEIYRIVSSKALDSGDGAQATIGAGTNISLSKAADDDSSKGGKCC
jgi:Ras-related protein Rab-11A